MKASRPHRAAQGQSIHCAYPQGGIKPAVAANSFRLAGAFAPTAGSKLINKQPHRFDPA